VPDFEHFADWHERSDSNWHHRHDCDLSEARSRWHNSIPLAGQAVVANLMPGRYGVVATPGADRIGRGEEWLQTNTLDGQKAHDSFLRIGEPSSSRSLGRPATTCPSALPTRRSSMAVWQAFVRATDPNITGTNCTNTITGTVTTERMSGRR